MHSWTRDLIGILCITAVIAAGFWHANAPEILEQRLSHDAAASRAAPETRVRYAHWSSDGRVLFSLARGGGNAGLSLSLHSLAEKSSRTPIELGTSRIASAALAPDGLHALVATFDGHLLWVGLQTAQVAVFDELPRYAGLNATAVAPGGRRCAADTSAGAIWVFDPTGDSSIILACPRSTPISYLAFSRDAKYLVSAQNNGWIGLWNLTTGELLQEFTGHRDRVTIALLLPDGKRIISSGFDGTVRIWDVASGRQLWHEEFDALGVTALAVSEDGTAAAWGDRMSKIFVWDLERGQKQFEINTSASDISHLRFSPDGSSLAVAENDERIHLYDARTGIEQEGIRVDVAHLVK